MNLKVLHDIACYLRAMVGSPNITSAGVDISVPGNFKSIAVVKTNDTGTVNVTLSDGSIYPMTAQGETFADGATAGTLLPAYTIATSDGGTWKWHGIQ